ncbi:RNA polymerase sigma factor [Pedobacter hiemivivus]|uniref:RNA polymerase sigma factor n=2 Tax=Pedobacter hiemivivus TaxID=2530454 RepID=A0A4U1G1G1_9SPHI|nr:RNA polymerase sigma factor [Pedobacter hiemivivus]TKC57258.1 RNA polymerase sigma factor [Pedobacter hiemivivus]
MLKVLKKSTGLAELIAAAKDQKESAKEALYKFYYGYLMAVIMRYTRNSNDSEELVNDSFIRIFQNLSKFCPPTQSADLEKAFMGWIVKISCRIAIDFLRKGKLLTVDEELYDDVHPLINPDVMPHLNAQDILKMINNLPETQRLIFNMYEIEGFSHEEISRTLNVQENISRVYLGRAKQKLRLLYQKSTVDSDGTY